jgi:hypothetical protein
MLELEADSDPIVGSLQAHGRCVDFSGWVGLATALEQAISTAPDDTPDRSTGIDTRSDKLRQLS